MFCISNVSANEMRKTFAQWELKSLYSEECHMETSESTFRGGGVPGGDPGGVPGSDPGGSELWDVSRLREGPASMISEPGGSLTMSGD